MVVLKGCAYSMAGDANADGRIFSDVDLLVPRAHIDATERQLIVAASGKLRAKSPVGDAKLRGLDWVGDDIVLVTNSATGSLGPMFTAPKWSFVL